jgi:hypothetical protein
VDARARAIEQQRLDFEALRKIAQDGTDVVTTADIFGNVRPRVGDPDFAPATGRSRTLLQPLYVPDFPPPHLTVPATFRCTIMDVTLPNYPREVLALCSELDWSTSTGDREATRTNYVIRLTPGTPTGLSISAYWWRPCPAYTGKTFAERLSDDHRRAYFTRVTNLVKDDGPLYGMLSPTPCPKIDTLILGSIRPYFEQAFSYASKD